MGSKWPTVRFCELYAEPSRNGVTSPKAGRGAGVPMLGMGDVFSNGRVGDGDYERIPLSVAEFERSRLRHGDLLFARRSLTLAGAGQCAIYCGAADSTFESSIIRCRLDPSGASSEFYYYFFRSPIGRSVMETIVEQTAVAGIRASDLGRLLVPRPTLDVQHRVAAILGALDDKIELNRRMSRTLDELAQAIFKSWFVDGAGEVLPPGWAWGSLGDVVRIEKSILDPRKSPEEWFDHYSIPAFDVAAVPAVQRGAEIKSSKVVVHEGAVLLSKLNPRTPRVWWPVLDASRRSIASTEFLVLVPRESFTREFVYGLASSTFVTEKMVSCVTGTSGSHQRVRPETVMSVPVPIPDAPLLERYTASTAAICHRSAQALQEVTALTSIRDTVLPVLLSGALAAGGAEPGGRAC
jgi:type I restriction enzyme S subunit